MLVVGDRHRSPRTVLPGPVVGSRDGRVVPVAWLPRPRTGRARPVRRAAARVHARAAGRHGSPLRCLRAQRAAPQFGDLADRMVRVLGHDGGDRVRCHRMTAYERAPRRPRRRRWPAGPALSMYVGHGRPVGWVGYAGLRAHHVDRGRPGLGAGRGGALAAPAGPRAATHRAVVRRDDPAARRRRRGHRRGRPRRAHRQRPLGARASPARSGTVRTIGELVAMVAPHDPAGRRLPAPRRSHRPAPRRPAPGPSPPSPGGGLMTATPVLDRSTVMAVARRAPVAAPDVPRRRRPADAHLVRDLGVDSLAVAGVRGPARVPLRPRPSPTTTGHGSAPSTRSRSTSWPGPAGTRATREPARAAS